MSYTFLLFIQNESISAHILKDCSNMETLNSSNGNLGALVGCVYPNRVRENANKTLHSLLNPVNVSARVFFNE